MEENTQNKPPVKKRLWIRIVALVLVVAMIATAGIIEASRVVFTAANKANDAEAASAEYIDDNTDYLDASLIERMGDVLYAYLTDPVTLEDYYLRSSVAISKEKYAEAADYLEKCIELYKEGKIEETKYALLVKLGCLYALEGEYAKAIPAFDRAIELDSTDAQVFLLRAQMGAETGDAELALSDILSYEKLSGDTESLVYVKGPLYEMTGRYTEAAECYSIYLDPADTEKFDASYYANRARCYMMSQSMTEAAADADAFLKAGGTDEDGIMNYILASNALVTGDYEACEAYAQSAVSAGYAESFAAYTQILYSRYMREDYAGAVAAGKLAVATGGGSAELYQWLGISEMGINDFASALEYFNKSIEYSTETVDIYYYRGVCSLALEDYQAAEEDFTVSIDRAEQVGMSAYNRGVAYAGLGKYEESYHDMELAMTHLDDAETLQSARELYEQLKLVLAEDDANTKPVD